MEAQNHRGRPMTREEFFRWGIVAAGGIFSIVVAGPLVGFFLSPWFRKTPEQWVRVCSLDEINSLEPVQFRAAFPRNNAPEKYEDVRGVFVIRRDNDILAFSNICTHMDCSVRWLAWRQQILCPCHGGLYDRWGQLMGGPPAHSLPLYVRKVENNYLYIANRYEFRV